METSRIYQAIHGDQQYSGEKYLINFEKYKAKRRSALITFDIAPGIIIIPQIVSSSLQRSWAAYLHIEFNLTYNHRFVSSIDVYTWDYRDKNTSNAYHFVSLVDITEGLINKYKSAIFTIKGGLRIINASSVHCIGKIELGTKPFMKLARKINVPMLGDTAIFITLTLTSSKSRPISSLRQITRNLSNIVKFFSTNIGFKLQVI